jgi:hypothetical protein
MTKSARAGVFFAGAALVFAIGCEVLVPSAVPDFTCGAQTDSACPAGLVCDLTSGRCVTPGTPADEAGADGDDGPIDAPLDKKDASEGGSPLGLGQPCRFDNDCKSKLCGTSTILTTTFTGSSGPICTQSCCVSDDCPSTFICFNGGTGGGYCVPATKAQRTPPATGGKSAGTACVGATDCRSGLCQGSRCVDTCCVASDCAAGTVCAVGSLSAPSPAHDEWLCIPKVGSLNDGTSCIDNTQCKVNNCVGLLGSICPSCPVCTPSCCSAADCSAWGNIATSNQLATCSYGLSGSDQLKWCFQVDTSRAPLGTKCSSGIDCQSSYCDPELKNCAAVCCKDSDCGSGNICQPSAVNTPFLRCVPGTR